MHAFVSTLSKDAWMWYYCLPDKSITSLKNFLELIFKRWHNGEEDMMTALEKGFDQLKRIREQMEQFLHDDLNEEVYQNADIVEDPPHDPSTEILKIGDLFMIISVMMITFAPKTDLKKKPL